MDYKEVYVTHMDYINNEFTFIINCPINVLYILNKIFDNKAFIISKETSYKEILHHNYTFYELLNECILYKISLNNIKSFEMYCQQNNNIYLEKLFKSIMHKLSDKYTLPQDYEISKTVINIRNKQCNELCCEICGTVWDGYAQCNCYCEDKNKYLGYCKRCNKYTNEYC